MSYQYPVRTWTQIAEIPNLLVPGFGSVRFLVAPCQGKRPAEVQSGLWGSGVNSKPYPQKALLQGRHADIKDLLASLISCSRPSGGCLSVSSVFALSSDDQTLACCPESALPVSLSPQLWVRGSTALSSVLRRP